MVAALARSKASAKDSAKRWRGIYVNRLDICIRRSDLPRVWLPTLLPHSPLAARLVNTLDLQARWTHAGRTVELEIVVLEWAQRWGWEILSSDCDRLSTLLSTSRLLSRLLLTQRTFQGTFSGCNPAVRAIRGVSGALWVPPSATDGRYS